MLAATCGVMDVVQLVGAVTGVHGRGGQQSIKAAMSTASHHSRDVGAGRATVATQTTCFFAMSDNDTYDEDRVLLIQEQGQQRILEHASAPQFLEETVGVVQVPHEPVQQRTVEPAALLQMAEQTVVREDVHAAILRFEKWMRDCQVNDLRTKKEDLEQMENKKTVLLERASYAYFRDGRELQRMLDEI